MLPLMLCLLVLAGACSAAETARAPATARNHRILYNLDGDSCMTLKAGRKDPGPISREDLHTIVSELTQPGSHVDTLLVCINAQVMYYPTAIGTLRGTLSTPEEREKWPKGERQRFENIQRFFDAGLDPYAEILGDARRHGLETLLTFRMNDAHGNDFLRTAYWRDHPDQRLPGGALDWASPGVRDHVVALIGEALHRYDCDGIELDFQRFPTSFKNLETPERVERVNEVVRRVRQLADDEGRRRGRRLTVAARAPSNYGRSAPGYEASRAIGCDPAIWAREGWIDFLTVSEFLFERYDLDLRSWRERVPGIPIYGGIECTEGPTREQALTAPRYRRAARHLWSQGASGIYLFNFFTTRENGADAYEPPFEVLRQLGDPQGLAAIPFGPWETNRPIASVKREVYQRHSAPRAAVMTAVQYVGPGMERREWQAVERVSDVADGQRARWSADNGRTWGDWIPQAPSSLVDYAGVKVSESGWGDIHDPASGRLVQLWLRQVEVKGVFHNTTYWRTSQDQGRSWSPPRMLRYEEGPEFDPAQPLATGFLEQNNGYPGNTILRRRDGSLVVCLAHANAPGDPRNATRPWRLGSVLFLGRWDPAANDYRWEPGARVEIGVEQSARGLMEPEVAELQDGRLLVVWRGSNTGWDGSVAREPGRKWFSLSTDGGRTLGAVGPWAYAEGTPFYSPSSIHRMLRHGVTGKLYWIGNLCAEPPRGNHPRYPLVIAEVDETAAALRRETVTVIDDRHAHEGADVQLSNFSLLEDRETHQLELHLTTYGQESDPKDWATADSIRYRVTLR